MFVITTPASPLSPGRRMSRTEIGFATVRLSSLYAKVFSFTPTTVTTYSVKESGSLKSTETFPFSSVTRFGRNTAVARKSFLICKAVPPSSSITASSSDSAFEYSMSSISANALALSKSIPRASDALDDAVAFFISLMSEYLYASSLALSS